MFLEFGTLILFLVIFLFICAFLDGGCISKISRQNLYRIIDILWAHRFHLTNSQRMSYFYEYPGLCYGMFGQGIGTQMKTDQWEMIF